MPRPGVRTVESSLFLDWMGGRGRDVRVRVDGLVFTLGTLPRLFDDEPQATVRCATGVPLHRASHKRISGAKVRSLRLKTQMTAMYHTATFLVSNAETGERGRPRRRSQRTSSWSVQCTLAKKRHGTDLKHRRRRPEVCYLHNSCRKSDRTWPSTMSRCQISRAPPGTAAPP